jgi:hypothetical protein
LSPLEKESCHRPLVQDRHCVGACSVQTFHFHNAVHRFAIVLCMTRICDLSSKFKVSDIFVHGLIRYDLTFGDSCGFFAMAIGLSAELRFVQIRQRVWSLTNNEKLSRNFRTDPSIGSSLIQRPEPENERPSHSSLGLASLTVRLRPEKSLPANPLHRCMSFSGIVQRYKTEARGRPVLRSVISFTSLTVRMKRTIPQVLLRLY